MRIKFLFLALVLLSLLTSCTGKAPSPVPTSTPDPRFAQADLAWLKVNAIPFDTSDPAELLEDLAPLKSIVGDARIVALGDATGGTHEFLQMKHRLLEYLVENMGFNTLAIWAGYPEAERINSYVHTGEGDPAEILKSLNYPNLDTQEVLDMVEWIRAYNGNPGNTRKVSFRGFDMQHDQLARDDVAQFIQKVDPEQVSQINDDYSCYPQLSDACMKKLQNVVDLLNDHRSAYIAVASQAEFEQALHSARIVTQNVTSSSQSNNYDLYSQYLAENVEWIVDQAAPDGKVVVWAHNFHVWKYSQGSYHPLGDRLHQQYGGQLLIFGFLFYHGSFQALGVGSQNLIKTFHAAEPPGDSYEFFLQATGLPRFFLDMRVAQPKTSDQDWLFTPHSFYQVGGYYDPNNPPYGTAPLASMFDVVIYFKDTSPSLLLNQ